MPIFCQLESVEIKHFQVSKFVMIQFKFRPGSRSETSRTQLKLIHCPQMNVESGRMADGVWECDRWKVADAVDT